MTHHQPPQPLDPRLDRLVEYDDRSRGYQIRTLLDRLEARAPRTFSWATGHTLDQGREGACVGFSLSHRLMAMPVRQTGISNRTAQELYKRAQLLDQWPGESYDGTSILAGVKAAQEKGYVGEYRWVGAGSGKAIDDVVESLGYVGPIVFGLNWYRSMGQPRPSGLLEVNISNADLMGGHAICATGVYLRTRLRGETTLMDLIMFQNSWGTRWGRSGFCYMQVADVERLLAQNGEGVLIVRETLPPGRR